MGLQGGRGFPDCCNAGPHPLPRYQLRLELVRSTFGETTVTGDLYVDGEWQCFTLEDRVRPDPNLLTPANEAKVSGETAIPDSTYQVVITPSPRFKRRLPLLVNVPGFDGIRIHPGNSHRDTEGCILVGEGVNQFSQEPMLTKSVSAFNALFDLMEEAIEAGESITVTVRNK